MSEKFEKLPILNRIEKCPKCGFYESSQKPYNLTFSEGDRVHDSTNGEHVDRECPDCGYTVTFRPRDWVEPEPEWVEPEKKPQAAQAATNILNTAAASAAKPVTAVNTTASVAPAAQSRAVAPVTYVKPEPKACSGCPMESQEK